MHSLTGTMAISEAPLVEAALMAIAEINQTGGVLGQRIEAIVTDGASDPAQFACNARKLIECDRINTLFGCWTSASRKAVLPVLEEFNAQLWYPIQYEGLECAKNIFYTGPCPNQQVEPAITWLLNNKGKRFYLLGSDSVFPRTANKLIKAQLKHQNGTVLAEDYVPLGATEFTDIINRIQQLNPDVVFNTLNGDSNIAFYHQYQASGITAEEIPIMAVSIAEAELQRIGEAATGHYACWNYFQSLDTPNNQQFLQHFKTRYGPNRVTSAPIEAAYTQVYLWKQAVELATSFDVEQVRVAAYGQTFEAPSGFVRIEPNHHVWKTCRIGRILPIGQFELVYTYNHPIKPLPWLGVEELRIEGSDELKVETLQVEGSDELKVEILRVEGLKNNLQPDNIQPTNLQSDNFQSTNLQPDNIQQLHPNNWDRVIDMLAEVSQGIHNAWQLEQKSRGLEDAKEQLQRELVQNQRVEAVLRDSEAELHALLAAMTDLVLVLDLQGRYLKIAPTNLALLHKKSDELIGKTLYEVFPHEQADTFVKCIRNAHATQQTVNVEYCYRTLNEQDVWLAASISPISEESVIWVARDITERKRAEESLRATEERFRITFEQAAVGIAHVGLDGRFFQPNQRFCEIVGFSAEELMALTFADITHADDVSAVQACQQQLLAFKMQTCSLEKRYVRSRGSVVWVNLTLSLVRYPSGEPAYFINVVEDISEKKLAQEALQESEARLRLALHAAQMGTWDWNILPDELVYSDQLGPIFGLPKGAYHATFDDFLKSVHPEDRENVVRAMTHAVFQGADYAVEFRVIWPDGSLHWVGNKGQVYYDKTGLPIRMVGVAMDISDAYWQAAQRKLATEALRQSEERMRALLNAIPDRMFRHRVDGTYLDVKAQQEDLIVPAEMLIGTNLRDTPIPEGVKQRLLELLATAVHTGELQTYEHALPRANGIHSYEARIVKSGADEAVCIVRDITERKQAEEALRQQKEILQTIFDHIPIMVVFYDATGQMLLLNREVERILGWSIEEVGAIDLLAECYPDSEYRQKVLDFMLAPTGKWREFKTKTKDGQILDTLWANIALSDGTKIGIGQDITERKQTEEARRQAEKRYRSIFENTVEGLFQIGPDGRILNANPGLARIYGYDSPDELIAHLTYLDRERYVDECRWDEFLHIMRSQERVSDFESQVYRQDGKVIWISENAHIVRDAKGELLYYEGSVVDITKRKVWEEALRYQQECTEDLLLNILPSPIAQRLKRAESTIADSFPDVTVLFADLVSFTEFSAQIPPTKLVKLLNKIFSKFDLLAEKHGLEKIKTIGDAYMVVGGLPRTRPDHAEAIAQMALDMQQEIARFKGNDGEPFRLRIGINTGPVVAGVIGTKKFTYDLWGDTVNVASRMECQGIAGRIQVTATTYERLKARYLFEPRGVTLVKGKGEMMTYWLIGKKDCDAPG